MGRIPLSRVVWVVGIIFIWTATALATDKVVVFHAGSLNVPFAKIEKIFETRHPGIDIVRTAGGSTKMARLISEDGLSADIMASADYRVIDKNLIPEHAGWNVRFATNQLVLCYTDKSKFSGEVNDGNWRDVLARKGVAWGHSDPNLDPCGYRSLMVLQLAEKFYKDPGLYDRLIANRPEENVKAKAVQLVSLLKSGQMDYGWEYLSVAVQHGLNYVKLDDHINLGNYKFDAFYKQAKVKVSGQEPGTWIDRTGKSCTYGITLMKSAPHKAGAELFLDYLLSPAGGLKILQEMGQPPFTPCRVPDADMLKALPKRLQSKVEVHL